MRSILSALCLLFFLTAFALFYHFNPAVQRIALHSSALLVGLLFVLSCCGLGWPLASRLAAEQDSMMQAIVSLAFGVGLTGILNVLTGLIAEYSVPLFAVWYLAGFILFVVALRHWRPHLRFHLSPTVWSLLSVLVLFLFLVPLIPFFVAPEVSTDAVTYHLLLPKIFLSSGRLHFLPLFVEASYPNLAEMNYLGILALAGEIACKCFHFWIGIALLILLAKIVRKVSTDASSLLAPALFLSMPVVVIHLGWAWNDFLYSLFVLLSVFYFLHIHLSESAGQTNRNYLLAGIFAGLASWTKYTFVIYFLTSLLVLLFGARKWKWQPKYFSYYFLGIAIVAPFWMFQNWLFTGNPVYPFLNQIFKSPFWTDAANHYFIYHLRRYEITDWNWSTYFLFPARIALNPRIIETHTGILPFACIPLLFFRSASRGISFLKTYLFLGIIVWLSIQTETRSMLTLFAAFFCIVSIELQQRVRWRFLFATLIGVALAANLFVAMITTEHLFSPMAYFLGLESKAQYIARMVPGQRAYDFLNAKSPVQRVLLVSLHGPFYFNQSYFLNDYSDPPVAEVLTHDLRSPEEIARKFAALRISHVIIDPGKYKEENEVGLYSWNKEQRVRFETFLLKNCKELARFSDGFVYEVSGSTE